MTTMPLRVTAGVDTHLDVHVAAVLDHRGGLLGVESFETTPAGYRGLLGWLRGFGEIELVGVEGTGSYGAGLTRHLQRQAVRVVEVDRPNRQRRRRRGKSDPQDAITAARAAQSGDARGEAKTRDGNVEAMRVLRVARSSARKARTQALNQMRSIIATGPEPIRAELRNLNVYRLLAHAAAYRPGQRHDVASLTKRTLRMLARRALALEAEVAELDTILELLVAETAPALAARPGIGTDCASALLVAAGDNPQRLRNEGTSFIGSLESGVPRFTESSLRYSSSSAIAGHRRVILKLNEDSSGHPRGGLLHLHTDGSSFVAVDIGLRPQLNGEPADWLNVDDEQLIQELFWSLIAAARHAVGSCHTGGDATLEARLACLPGAKLSHRRGHFGGHWTQETISQMAPSRHTIALDSVSSSPIELVVATRTVATDLFQSFGLAECPHITADGTIRRRYWTRTQLVDEECARLGLARTDDTID